MVYTDVPRTGDDRHTTHSLISRHLRGCECFSCFLGHFCSFRPENTGFVLVMQESSLGVNVLSMCALTSRCGEQGGRVSRLVPIVLHTCKTHTINAL
jgi:hypothetical protein